MSPVRSKRARSVGLTPLHRAAQQDHVEMVMLLISMGESRASARLWGRGVAGSGDCKLPEVAKELLDAGADVNAANTEGVTALHAASFKWSL